MDNYISKPFSMEEELLLRVICLAAESANPTIKQHSDYLIDAKFNDNKQSTIETISKLVNWCIGNYQFFTHGKNMFPRERTQGVYFGLKKGHRTHLIIDSSERNTSISHLVDVLDTNSYEEFISLLCIFCTNNLRKCDIVKFDDANQRVFFKSFGVSDTIQTIRSIKDLLNELNSMRNFKANLVSDNKLLEEMDSLQEVEEYWSLNNRIKKEGAVDLFFEIHMPRFKKTNIRSMVTMHRLQYAMG